MTRDEALLLPVDTPLFHCHHTGLFEFATYPVVERWDYISSEKPIAEIPTRLRLMRAVRGPMPQVLLDAWLAYREQWDAWDVVSVTGSSRQQKAGFDAWSRARSAYLTILADCTDALLVLHTRECPDCPWDGWTIFPDIDRQDRSTPPDLPADHS